MIAYLLNRSDSLVVVNGESADSQPWYGEGVAVLQRVVMVAIRSLPTTFVKVVEIESIVRDLFASGNDSDDDGGCGGGFVVVVLLCLLLLRREASL